MDECITVIQAAGQDEIIATETKVVELLEVKIDDSVTVVAVEDSTVVTPEVRDEVVTDTVQVVTIATALEQGPPGPPGAPGPAGGQVVQRRAGMTISALHVVYEDRFGQVWPADHDVPGDVFTLLGLTLSSADTGQPVNVQRYGHVDDDGWAWPVGARIYLGRQGRIQVGPPAGRFEVLIGAALSPTRLQLNIQDPIEME